VVFASYERLRYVTSVEDKEAETGRVCYTEISVWDPAGKYSRDLMSLADKYHAQFFYAEKGFGALYGIVEAMRFVGNFIEVFTLLIIIISLFHLNLIGFFERKKEIGTILALGAKPRWVIKLLLSEMLFLAAFGFIAAFVIYVIIMEAFSGGIDFGKLSIIFAGKPFLLGLSLPAVLEAGAIIFLTILSSIVYPAYLATRIDPVEIFREGNL
jgi:ABC-type antimicrobial peptide transport system permease subunit